MIENEVVKEEEARNYAKEVGAIFKNTSAFNDVGVNELFEELGMYFVDPNYQNIIQKSGRTKEENFTLKKTNVQEKKNVAVKINCFYLYIIKGFLYLLIEGLFYFCYFGYKRILK